MESKNAYRHELKYSVSYAGYLALRARLRPVMEPDPHAGGDGCYTIRSIYFDNYSDTVLREKLDGVRKREKFRLRWYNDELSLIHLEKKMKHDNLCLKLSAQLTEEECRALCAGRVDWMLAHPSQLVRELRCKMTLRQLRPRVLVSYLREPYVYGPGNVRVTFDSRIRTSLFRRELLERGPDISAADSPGDMLMEVKYDGFLPEIIAALLQTGDLRQQSFSKYGACRRYG